MPRPLRFGLWYDFRNPPRWRRDPTELYRGIVAQVVRAEQLGWDDVWLSEHHFIDDGYTPSMLPLACALAAATSRVQIGTSVLLLPLHDPLRVAEDAATVDVMSGGRFQLGVAAGYRRGEFAGFGVPMKERAARMDEALPILRRLFAGERVHTPDARFYRYADVELHPRPVQRAPKLWVGGFSEPAVRRAARLGDAFIATGPVGPLVELYRAELAKHGKDPDAHEIAAGITWLLVARDPARRWREAEAHFLYQINLYAEWFGEAGMSVATRAVDGADLRARGVRIVSPAEAIDAGEYARAIPITRFYGWTIPPGLPPEWADEHLELMAREVIPHLRAR